MSQENTKSSYITDRFEQLRLILAGEQRRDVAYTEAVEVGESLISFFEVLADETDTPRT